MRIGGDPADGGWGGGRGSRGDGGGDPADGLAVIDT